MKIRSMISLIMIWAMVGIQVCSSLSLKVEKTEKKKVKCCVVLVQDQIH